MNETSHGFKCSDTPGVYECPKCPASAHYERDEGRYCIHPADKDEPAFLVSEWSDVPSSAHVDPRPVLTDAYILGSDLDA